MTDARYPSKLRVERGDYLVYAEGDEIPATDVDELIRQGYLPASDVWRVSPGTGVPMEEGIEVPADGTWSPTLTGDGTGTALPPVEPEVVPEPASKAPAKARARKAT